MKKIIINPGDLVLEGSLLGYISKIEQVTDTKYVYHVIWNGKYTETTRKYGRLSIRKLVDNVRKYMDEQTKA